MSISGVVLQPTIIRGKALDYFRFMSGREVRARVVQGGEPGGMAVLRMGEHTIKARIQGMAIPAGRNLFVRIEKDGGGYRLITLDKSSIPTPGQAISGAGATMSDIPPAVLAGFREFLEQARRKLTGSPSKTGAKPGTGDTPREGNTAGKIALDGSMMENLGRILLDESPGEMDGLMYLAWHEGSADSASNEPMSLVGQGDFSQEPRHYFVHADLKRLGPLGILFTAPDEHFEDLSIWLAPSLPGTERLFRSMLEDWKSELRGSGFNVRELGLLPSAHADKSPGLDIRA